MPLSACLLAGENTPSPLIRDLTSRDEKMGGSLNTDKWVIQETHSNNIFNKA